MARVKVTAANRTREDASQNEFYTEMECVRRALYVIEEGREKTISEKLRITGVAKKSSTVKRIRIMKKMKKEYCIKCAQS